ncbi:MAG: hypothetical protein A3H70_01460 [Candidatus Komeilibacteria bacterium RIFCSPLOWO2_02_FULL_48_11]|uniref:Metallo-beta-lactamase domain-containing protein n=1 Tax=Candidatus Komeilibacteria bacterium RIFCSPLOWO2_02_FULL_48_11 TaxID=1798553 RepID=A0A1G2BR93_9BACT|nr:MAG: hypothetical protein A3H70_01460 [Candidatus Komeilibacteria bacterium RIFCSPLOWO2_02_FULL_48_11]
MTLKRYQQIIVLLTGLTLVIIVLTFILYWQARNKPNVEVVFLDVGQGDSILIKTKYNQQILIDGGPDANVLGRLGRHLPFYDKDLDLVIATHPDADHIAGLVDVLKRYRVGLMLEPGLAHPTGIYQALQQEIAKKSITQHLVASRQIYDLGDNLFLDVLYPDTSFVGQDLEDANSASIVVRLTDGQIDYLFTGDAPIETEDKIAALYGSGLDSEILKLGHHGSKTSSSEPFLEAVAPEAAVISVGRDNRYGHPSLTILNRLKKLQIPVLRTDELGDIKLRSDGEYVELK